MIKFTSVKFKNFISYGNSLTEIQLDKSPTTLLVGNSGSGKSTVEDAITFALFGKAFRNINKPQIVNSINNSDCLVEIDFEIGKNTYKIRRGLKPTIFEIFCNGMLINQDSHSKDYQEHLENNILGMNYKTFTQIVVLGVANFTPFMQLKPADRRILIEDLLDIEIFSTMANLLKEKTATVKLNITQNGYDIQNTKDKIDIYLRHIEEIKKDKERQIEDNNKKIEEIKKEIENRHSKQKTLLEDISSLEETIVDEDSIRDKMYTLRDYKRDIDNNLRKIRKDLEFYRNNPVCPTCNREFDHEHTDSILKEMEGKEKEYITGLDIINKNLEKNSSRQNEIDEVHEKIKIINKKKNDEEIKISSSRQFLKKIKEENEEIKQSQKDCTEETKNLEELKEKLKELEKDKEKLSNDKLIHEIASNLLKDGGVKTKIIKQYIPIINKLVNRFLNSMNFNVTFSLDENFNETIKNRGREDFTYSCFSEGERQRLDMAILLTWRTIASMKNSIKTNILFLDEVLDSSLNIEAAENVVELIKNEPILKGSNIFVISHKTTMVDKFSDSLTFEKYKNFSRIVQ